MDADAERAIDMVCETVSAIRSTRARYGISPKTQLAVAVKAGEDDIARLEAQRGLIEGMGNVASLQMAADVEKPAESSVTLAPGLEVYIVLSGLVDFEAERARLEAGRRRREAGQEAVEPGLFGEGRARDRGEGSRQACRDDRQAGSRGSAAGGAGVACVPVREHPS